MLSYSNLADEVIPARLIVFYSAFIYCEIELQEVKQQPLNVQMSQNKKRRKPKKGIRPQDKLRLFLLHIRDQERG